MWTRGCGAWFIAQNSKCQFVVAVVFVVLHGILYSANKMRCVCVYVYNALMSWVRLQFCLINASPSHCSLTQCTICALCYIFFPFCTQLKSIFLFSHSPHALPWWRLLLCTHTFSPFRLFELKLSIFVSTKFTPTSIRNIHTHTHWYNHLSIWRPMYFPAFLCHPRLLLLLLFLFSTLPWRLSGFAIQK